MTYFHETFPTFDIKDGITFAIDIPSAQLTEEEKDVINLTLSGNHPLRNPYGSDIVTKATEAKAIANFFQSVIPTEPPGTEFGYAVAASGIVGNFIRIADHLDNQYNSNGTGPSFKEHTDRISGKSMQPDGERYPFTGVQGIARAYNGMKESMRNDADPVEDNYSIFFTSILNAGKSVMEDTKGLVTSNGSVSGITFSDLTISNIEGISADSFRVANGVISLIETDNDNFDNALNYVKAYGLGSMILGMNRDTYFGKKLLDSGIATNALSSELDDIV